MHGTTVKSIKYSYFTLRSSLQFEFMNCRSSRGNRGVDGTIIIKWILK